MEHPSSSSDQIEPTGELYNIPTMHGLAARIIQSRFTLDRPQLNGKQGLEVETGILNERTGEPVRASTILQDINLELQAALKPEVCSSVVEQNIPHGSLAEVEASFIKHQAAMVRALDSTGHIALPVGMIPHSGRANAQESLWQTMLNHPDPFYRKVLIPRDGDSVKALAYMSGLQPHTEQLHGPSAVTAVRALSILSPFLIALAASSPVINGVYRGFQSERIAEKSNLRADLTGLIPEDAVSSYKSMQEFLHRSAADPKRLSISPGYYWVRQPRIELGTVETATMDAIPDPDHALRMGRLSRDVVLAVARDMSDGINELPHELFGDGSLSEANRAWVYATVNKLQKAESVGSTNFTDINGRQECVSNYLDRLMQWADTRERDKNAIRGFLAEGTIAERIVRQLELKPGLAQEVADSKLKNVYLQWANHYRNELTNMALAIAA